MDYDDCVECINSEKKEGKLFCNELEDYVENLKDLDTCPEHDHEFGNELGIDD